MSLFVACHAAGASLAVLLGAVNLVHRPKGDRVHRVIGRVWVVAMYWTVISSFFIRELNPGHFSWIHGLSLFTFVTLTLGLWAAVTGHVEMHRQNMRNTYFGTIGAFVGAVAVPQRDVPQLAVHHPFVLSVAALLVAATAGLVVTLARRSARAPRGDVVVPGGPAPASTLVPPAG